MSSSLYYEPAFQRLPRAPLWRRGVASTLDFVLVWLLSAVGISGLSGPQVGQWVVFLLLWLVLRVVVTAKNQGQSPGHWAFDMKVVHERTGRGLKLHELTRREATLGLGALLVLITLSHLYWGLVMVLLPVPLIIDCAAALTTPLTRQTLHDRLAQSIVVQTDRGFSLDLKIKRLLEHTRRRMQ